MMSHLYDDELMHYGVGVLDGSPGRGSGRYPRGSGKNPNQHSGGDFITRVDDLRRKGMSDTDIARHLNLSTTQFRVQIAIANEERRSVNVATARRLREEGNSLNEIARKMGYKNDSSVRTLLNENAESRMNQSKVTADYLKQIVDEKGMLDVGAGQERFAGVSRVKFDEDDNPIFSHNMFIYDCSKEDIMNDLSYLDEKGDCCVRILHEARRESEYNERTVDDFVNFVIELQCKFTNIKFWCGKNLYNWETDYEFPYKPSCEEKYASVCPPKIIDDWYPKMFAKRHNKEIKEKGTDCDILLIDFVDL